MLKRMAECVELAVGDLVQIQLQLQLGHLQEMLRLRKALVAGDRTQLLESRYRSLKPFVRVLPHHPAPSSYSCGRYARSMTAS